MEHHAAYAPDGLKPELVRRRLADVVEQWVAHLDHSSAYVDQLPGVDALDPADPALAELTADGALSPYGLWNAFVAAVTYVTETHSAVEDDEDLLAEIQPSHESALATITQLVKEVDQRCGHESEVADWLFQLQLWVQGWFAEQQAQHPTGPLPWLAFGSHMSDVADALENMRQLRPMIELLPKGKRGRDDSALICLDAALSNVPTIRQAFQDIDKARKAMQQALGDFDKAFVGESEATQAAFGKALILVCKGAATAVGVLAESRSAMANAMRCLHRWLKLSFLGDRAETTVYDWANTNALVYDQEASRAQAALGQLIHKATTQLAEAKGQTMAFRIPEVEKQTWPASLDAGLQEPDQDVLQRLRRGGYKGTRRTNPQKDSATEDPRPSTGTASQRRQQQHAGASATRTPSLTKAALASLMAFADEAKDVANTYSIELSRIESLFDSLKSTFKPSQSRFSKKKTKKRKLEGSTKHRFVMGLIGGYLRASRGLASDARELKRIAGNGTIDAARALDCLRAMRETLDLIAIDNLISRAKEVVQIAQALGTRIQVGEGGKPMLGMDEIVTEVATNLAKVNRRATDLSNRAKDLAALVAPRSG